MPCCQEDKGKNTLLSVYVQPRSSRNELAGLHDGALKLRLTTPPVDGKANKAVLAFLAKRLKVPKSSLSIKSGHKSRRKQVLIPSLLPEQVRHSLDLDSEG